MPKTLLPISALACCLVSCSASAATATGSFNVRVTIATTCQVDSATDLDFGSAGVLNANIDQVSTITVSCTNTTHYTIRLDQGVNGTSVTTRQMIGGPTNELIDYSLYSNAGRTTNWGETDGTDTVAGTGNGTGQAYTVYGRIPPQTTPTPGTYTDTINITINY
jgi:spore coat protein U-like protein